MNRLSELEEDEETYASVTLGSNHEVNEEQEHKVLVVTWHNDTDELRIDLSDLVKLSENLSVTKRTVLKVTAWVYDPLGWISPILIEMRKSPRKSMLKNCNNFIHFKREILKRFLLFCRTMEYTSHDINLL